MLRLNKFFEHAFILSSTFLILTTLFYLLFAITFGNIKLHVVIESSNCEKHNIVGDVINPKTGNIYQQDLEQISSTINFPLRSKVIGISLCPGANLVISDISVVTKNQEFSILDKLSSTFHFCISCTFKIQKNSLRLSGSPSETSQFDILFFRNTLPMSFQITYAILRYTPYILTFWTIANITFLVPKFHKLTRKIYILTFLLLLLFVVGYKLFGYILPPGKIGEGKLIGSAQFTGPTANKDTFLYLLLAISPFAVSRILKKFTK